jgi:hypothetical protein
VNVVSCARIGFALDSIVCLNFAGGSNVIFDHAIGLLGRKNKMQVFHSLCSCYYRVRGLIVDYDEKLEILFGSLFDR